MKPLSSIIFAGIVSLITFGEAGKAQDAQQVLERELADDIIFTARKRTNPMQASLIGCILNIQVTFTQNCSLKSKPKAKEDIIDLREVRLVEFEGAAGRNVVLFWFKPRVSAALKNVSDAGAPGLMQGGSRKSSLQYYSREGIGSAFIAELCSGITFPNHLGSHYFTYRADPEKGVTSARKIDRYRRTYCQ
jgi:hypothetical protein